MPVEFANILAQVEAALNAPSVPVEFVVALQRLLSLFHSRGV